MSLEWIRTRLCDPEDKVRLTACKVLREVGMENDLKNLDRPLLLSIAERIKDKKVIRLFRGGECPFSYLFNTRN